MAFVSLLMFGLSQVELIQGRFSYESASPFVKSCHFLCALSHDGRNTATGACGVL